MMICVAGAAVLMSIVLIFRFSLVMCLTALGRARDIGKEHQDERGPDIMQRFAELDLAGFPTH